MEISYGFKRLEKLLPNPVATLGNFDGVHKGHQALIRQVIKRVQTLGGTSLVLTFKPHPLKVLSPRVDLRLLASHVEKESMLKDMGVDQLVCIPFTRAFSSLSPEEFVRELLCRRLQVKEVIVGKGFSFGKNRAGKVKDLKRMGKQMGFEVHSVDTIKKKGQPVSSSRIRELLKKGRVKEAARLLGRLYSLEGKIMRGHRRGMGLGFPTANLKIPKERVVPANGVYAAWGVMNHEIKKGVAYIGTQPTLGPHERMIELHFFDPHPNLYAKNIRIGFQDFIREEKVFSTEDDLKNQIARDVRKAKQVLHAKPKGEMLMLAGKSG